MRRAERDEVVDEYGYAQGDVRELYPLGLSQDGKRLMLLDFDTNYLLRLDLNTLQADVALDDGQLEALYAQMPSLRSRGLTHLSMLWWNGASLLCGRSNPGGYALQLSSED